MIDLLQQEEAEAVKSFQVQLAAAEGGLGDGKGKWQLSVDSAREIVVLSLLRSPTGHLTNLSTAPSLNPA